MRIRRLFIAIVCAFATLNAFAQYTCYVGGSDITIDAPPTNNSRYPDLLEITWKVQGGGTNVISLSGDTRTPVTVHPRGAGTAIIICSATYYNKTLWASDPFYKGETTIIKNYTVTCIDNTGGGGNTGGGDDIGGGGGNTGGGGSAPSGWTLQGDLYVSTVNTVEGIPMKFVLASESQKHCTPYGNSLTESCINRNTSGKVTIPNEVNGYRVVQTGSYAFEECKNITSVVIPSSVEYISYATFRNCTSLASIDIPSSVVEIRNESFYDCEGLVSITIPNSVEYIEGSAFYSCGNLESATIGTGVKEIGSWAFYYCNSLKTITSLRETPPTLKGKIHNSPQNITIYVPSQSAKEQYAKAAYWKDFKEIKVIGEKDEVQPDEISVSPSSKTIKVDETFTPTYTISPSDATTTVTWSSDDSKIASVNATTGKVTGVKAGTTYINATTANGKTARCKVTVEAKTVEPTSISVSPSSKTIKVGDTFTPTYTISPSNATTTVTWSSDDSKIASVNATTGKVTGVKAGTTYINATTSNGKTARCKVTVEEKISGIAIDATNFPDENFRNWLLGQSYGKDGVLTEEEIMGITSIGVWNKNITSLKGIEHFTALQELSCHNNRLTALDMSKNTALTTLYCFKNQLTALDVSKNTALTELNCYNNQLTALDVSKNTALTELYCSGNQLTALDVSKNTALTWLECNRNLLTALDVSKNTALTNLDCYRNHIKGTAMDALISSLPQNNTIKTHDINIYYQDTEGDEGNVCTKTQAAAIKAKGWTPRYYNGTWWLEYEGSDDEETGIALPTTETVEANMPVYTLSGQKVTGSLKGKKGIYIVGGKKVVIK